MTAGIRGKDRPVGVDRSLARSLCSLRRSRSLISAAGEAAPRTLVAPGAGALWLVGGQWPITARGLAGSPDGGLRIEDPAGGYLRHHIVRLYSAEQQTDLGAYYVDDLKRQKSYK